MDGVLSQMVLTALPDGAAEDGLARGAEAWMIIGNDMATATGNQGLQEGAPVHFGLGGAQETPSTRRRWSGPMP